MSLHHVQIFYRSNPADFPNAAEKLNVALKNVRKVNSAISNVTNLFLNINDTMKYYTYSIFVFQSCQALGKDLAALEAKKITGMENMPRFMTYHRDNVDLDFGNALLREIGTPVRFSKY